MARKKTAARGRGEAPRREEIRDVALAEATRERYLNYALSVITSRALPDVRDGLKPVQRRILYAMWNDLHVTADGRYVKCAAVVGEVMGKYHPHGDQSIYDALVRMAQAFSLRYPLIEGYGNFGSIDGDPPAAYAVHRVPAPADRRGAAQRAARPDGRLPAELRLDDRRAGRPAGAVPEPPGQRRRRDRRRDGDEHPAAQPEGGLQRPARPAGQTATCRSRSSSSTSRGPTSRPAA